MNENKLFKKSSFEKTHFAKNTPIAFRMAIFTRFDLPQEISVLF